LWFAEVPVKDAAGKTVRRPDGRVLKEKRKTSKHPDRGGNKDAKRWLAVWLDPDGKEVTQAFAKKKSAEDYAKKMEGDAERGDYIAKGAGKEKVGDLAEKWIRFRDVGGSSRERYEGVFRNQVQPAFGHRSVKGVKPTEILEWLREPEIAKLSGTTRLAAYMIVTGAFDLAVADKMRRDNPARADIIPVPEAEDMVRELWPVERVWAVIDQHPEEYRAIPVAAAGLGLRQGCALGLAEEDIDWDAQRVTVRRQVARIGGRYYFKLPKGNKERTVPLPRGVAAMLRAFIDAHPPEPYSLPWMNKDGKTAAGPHECRLLFRWQGDARRNHGKHISAPAYDARVWKPALSRAGAAPEPVRDRWGVLRYSSGGRENGMHALRHFYSTALQDGGVPPAGVTAFMGHSPKALPVTFRIYGHVTEETFEQARAAVDQRLFKIRPARSPGTVTELKVAQ
jgi:integrase